MRLIKLNIFLFILILLVSCSSNSKSVSVDLEGTWEDNSNGRINLKSDSSFIATNLSKEVNTLFSLSSENPIFSGIGKWVVENNGKQVKLIFNEIDHDSKRKGYYVLLVSGSNIFENEPPWYLFVWQDEAGGERIIFKKKL